MVRNSPLIVLLFSVFPAAAQATNCAPWLTSGLQMQRRAGGAARSGRLIDMERQTLALRCFIQCANRHFWMLAHGRR